MTMRLALAAVAALALAAAACGGSEDEPNLVQAAERTESQSSFAFARTIRSVQAGEYVDSDCRGAIDNDLRRARIACGEYDAIAVSDATYLRDEASGGTWVKLPSDGTDTLAAVSPQPLLELLRFPSGETEAVGEEEVRGEPTRRYALTVECAAVASDDCAGATADVDAWIDRDGLVRRLLVDDGELTTDVELFDFGVPVDIQLPPAHQVEELPELEPTPCAPVEGEPIGVEDALAALRSHGFHVRAVRECSATVAASLINTAADGMPLDDVQLSCSVYTEPL